MCKKCNDTKQLEYLCSNCHGSGEGMYDGARCRYCNQGTVIRECVFCELEEEEENEETL